MIPAVNCWAIIIRPLRGLELLVVQSRVQANAKWMWLRYTLPQFTWTSGLPQDLFSLEDKDASCPKDESVRLSSHRADRRLNFVREF
jgi:hypothetical protein